MNKSNTNNSEEFTINTSGLTLLAHEVSYDSDAFGFNVASIDKIELLDIQQARDDFTMLSKWVDCRCVDLVSCRLPHDQIQSSMFLESNEYKFVEMVLHPTYDLTQYHPKGLSNYHVSLANETDLDYLMEIAEKAFKYERYHLDPRINSGDANRRYAMWVKNAYMHKTQAVYKITLLSDIAGFFIIEQKSEGQVYWHLTARNPWITGYQIGYNVWQKMLTFHKESGAKSVTTTISARNTPVLNLYSKLNFRFLPPEITLHWCRDKNLIA